MEISNYIKSFVHEQRPDKRVLFSTKKASTIVLPPEKLDEIKAGVFSDQDRQTLIQLGMLVPDIATERKEMKCFVDKINSVSDKWNAMLVLTLDCNFACKYCFEDYCGKAKGDFYITREVADDFINFVMESSKNRKKVRVTFYGGEPLLCMDVIEYVTRMLDSRLEESGKEVTFAVVTNGSLLTLRNAERLLSWGVEAAKVTIDGPAEIHDNYRPFKNGTPSFDTIVKNIKSVCNSMRIQIGGNYTESGYRRFPELLDWLILSGLTQDNVSVRFSPVLGKGKASLLSDFTEGCLTINEPWAIDAGLFLREELLRRGFRPPQVKPSMCVIEAADAYTVNYNGDIYKCPGMLGVERFCIGDLKSGAADCSLLYEMDNWKNDECLGCAYLPLCFGGCRYALLLRTGEMSGVDCRKQYYDKVLAKKVNQDIHYNLYQ